MKDVLAGLLIFIIIFAMIIVSSEKAPTGKLEQVICANVTCYYEIKDNK